VAGRFVVQLEHSLIEEGLLQAEKDFQIRWWTVMA